MTVSPQIRLFALVGLLGALALAGGMFFLSRAQTDADADVPLPAARDPAARQATPRPRRSRPPSRSLASLP